MTKPVAWIIAVLFLLPSKADGGTTYRCTDGKGAVVFTDSPAQLEQCVPFVHESLSDATPSSPSKSRLQPAIPRHDAVPVEPSELPADRKEEVDEELDPKDDDAQDEGERPPNEMVIRLTKIGGALVTQVRLNHSVDAHLIVDTGATMTVLSYEVATGLGLLSGADNRISTVNTAGGQVQVSLAHIDHLQVGEAEAKNVDVAIHDLPDNIPGVSGLLGMSFLNHFVVSLDADRELLKLTPRK